MCDGLGLVGTNQISLRHGRTSICFLHPSIYLDPSSSFVCLAATREVGVGLGSECTPVMSLGLLNHAVSVCRTEEARGVVMQAATLASAPMAAG